MSPGARASRPRVSPGKRGRLVRLRISSPLLPAPNGAADTSPGRETWVSCPPIIGADPKRGVGTARYTRTVAKYAASAEKLKQRTLTNLYNESPAWLKAAHAKLDAAVFAAYGWPANISDDDLLARLLALNLSRAAANAHRPP